jgi:hypothetical protein
LSPIAGLDLVVQQLRCRRAIIAADLGDHFVGAAFQAEAVDVVPGKHHGELLAHLCQIEAEIGDPFAIHDNMHLRQVDL